MDATSGFLSLIIMYIISKIEIRTPPKMTIPAVSMVDPLSGVSCAGTGDRGLVVGKGVEIGAGFGIVVLFVFGIAVVSGCMVVTACCCPVTSVVVTAGPVVVVICFEFGVVFSVSSDVVKVDGVDAVDVAGFEYAVDSGMDVVGAVVV